jgi:hypothetical protein
MIIGGGNTQDGPARQLEPVSSSSHLDLKALEIECKRVVHEVSKCFIDLGLNEEDEDYAAGQLQAK